MTPAQEGETCGLRGRSRVNQVAGELEFASARIIGGFEYMAVTW